MRWKCKSRKLSGFDFEIHKPRVNVECEDECVVDVSFEPRGCLRHTISQEWEKENSERNTDVRVSGHEIPSRR